MKKPESVHDLSFDNEINEDILMAIVEESERSLVVIKFSKYPDSYLLFEKNAEQSLTIDHFMVGVQLEYMKLHSFGSSNTVLTSEKVSDIILRWSYPQIDFI